MKHYLVLLLLCLASSLTYAQSERIQVLLETNKGKIILELYNETPAHRDNFVAKVKSGAYDGVTFHRVIREFVIQGGNLKSKSLSPDQELEDDSEAGTLLPEIMPERYIHERGALAAARQPDEVNPDKLSSSSQFYIVTGKYHTEFDLDEIEQKHGRKYTPDQRKTYMMHGGTPSLDGAYTVFGRLIDGWNVVDKIQRIPTNDEDKPEKNIVIKRASLYSPKKK